jgi:hypothetical protein
MPDEDASFSPRTATLWGTLLQVALAAAALVPHWLLRGWPSLRQGLEQALMPAVIVPVFLVGAVVHEGLHALGFHLAGGVPWRDLRFVFIWKALMPAVHCRAAVTARAYRTSVVLPGLVTGVLPTLAGIVLGPGWLTVLGGFLLALAAGDLLVLIVVRRLASETQVMDHPSRVGCRVVEGRAEGR